MKPAHYIVVILLTVISHDGCFGLRKYTKEDIIKLREEAREMFQHAYDSYLRYAYPYDELRPLSCDGIDTWGSYSLTLIDALDTLAIMGNYTEFNRVVDLVVKRKDFDSDINVSVFETNIRIVGGLLSAHLLSHKTGMKLEPGWPCNGPLLRLAEDAAQRLIAAFDTTTGMPYGTINLRSGVPPGETSVTCTAGVGTFIIEFGTLSRLTGDPLYEEVAMNALRALYHHKSAIGLVGNHIDVMSGKWTAEDAGIGGGVDSYFEYLVKGAILLEKPELMSMFNEARTVIDKYLKREDWYVWGTMARGSITLPVFQSLESYWPGVLSLIGESDTALRIIHNYHGIWRQYGFTPEMYNLGTGEASVNKESYPLRPELIESIMYLYRETRDPVLLQMGEDILRSIQHSARTDCGYATIKDVRTHLKDDRMESFFLSETTKYLYLLFDPDNFIHNPGVSGKVIETAGGQCVIDVGGYIFNTEAHPVDPAILNCCHEARKGINLSEVHRIYEILEEEDNVKLMTLFENNEKELNESSSEEDFNDTLFNDDIDPIKTETKTAYVNLDGTERDKKQNVTKIIDNFFNKGDAKPTVHVSEIKDPVISNDFVPPSSTKARETFKLLPKVIQDFINNGWKVKSKCEPQYMLERIRKDVIYPIHPDENRFELLLTPAPTFLQRISLAGEFLNKKEL